jgi:hypothetical protein
MRRYHRGARGGRHTACGGAARRPGWRRWLGDWRGGGPPRPAATPAVAVVAASPRHRDGGSCARRRAHAAACISGPLQSSMPAGGFDFTSAARAEPAAGQTPAPAHRCGIVAPACSLLARHSLAGGPPAHPARPPRPRRGGGGARALRGGADPPAPPRRPPLPRPIVCANPPASPHAGATPRKPPQCRWRASTGDLRPLPPRGRARATSRRAPRRAARSASGAPPEAAPAGARGRRRAAAARCAVLRCAPRRPGAASGTLAHSRRGHSSQPPAPTRPRLHPGPRGRLGRGLPPLCQRVACSPAPAPQHARRACRARRPAPRRPAAPPPLRHPSNRQVQPGAAAVGAGRPQGGPLCG